MRDLLKTARANGVRGVVRGLTAFQASYTPIPAPTRTGFAGALLEVETAGRDLSYRERARLLDFAERYLTEANP